MAERTGGRRSPTHQVCAAFHQAVELIGRRWNGAIIEALLTGARRFCEIRAAVAGLKDPQLARRLRELEQQGIVRRRVIPTRPVVVEYDLTPKGEDLRPVMAEVHRWAQRWLSGPARPAPTGAPAAHAGHSRTDAARPPARRPRARTRRGRAGGAGKGVGEGFEPGPAQRGSPAEQLP